MDSYKIVLELVCFYLIFYFLIRMLKGTQSEGVIKSNIFFFVLLSPVFLFLTQNLSLYHLQYLFSHLIVIYIFGIIVVFQHDLRIGIFRMKHSLFGKVQGTREDEKELIAATVFMAQRKIGALIVIEQEVEVSTYIAHGIHVDAKLSKEMLWNIFWPGNPLHDGAIVLQRGRIQNARCILPLTEKPLSSVLGTRHRAGIGLSELTDAIVIIVSEERGEVSFCHKSKIHRNISPEELESKLKNIFSDESFLIDD